MEKRFSDLSGFHLARRLAVSAALAATLLLASCAADKPESTPAARPAEPVKISAFYPGQAFVAPGDRAQVCYGVENAVSVRLEPPVAEIRPLTTKCVWFRPEKSLSLTLIAVGAGGEEARQTIEISVKAGAPRSSPASSDEEAHETEGGLIGTFVATATQLPPGGTTTICYVLRKPATLRLEPSIGDLGTDLKKCIIARPATTTRYTLTATAGGETDTASVTIVVK
ncbi:MAG: hypothetical protein LC114_23400 [Bryobacterales bacterium]|nr:hypothetical protein [Bryobacterales bacterium]